jgi:hypothetical protein
MVKLLVTIANHAKLINGTFWSISTYLSGDPEVVCV